MHMRAVMTSRHLAIGSDLDGEIEAARGLGTHAGMPALARALRRAGLSGDEVRAVFGDNAWRVLDPIR
jgi:microsomal dipeptidase-like Zn-dependent dipeptidase